jgi:hypothetical protein
MKSKHLLKLSCGLEVELLLDEVSGIFKCTWSKYPTRAQKPGVLKEYLPWRNKIVGGWADRNKCRVLILDT